MQCLGRSGRRIGISLGLAALALAAQLVPAFAGGDAGVTYAAGGLTGGAINFGDFGGLTLNGAHQTTTATWSIANITDARGDGNGWNLSLTLTQFKEYSAGAYVTGGKALPTSSVTLTVAPTASQLDVTSSPANTITPVGTGTALDTGSAVKLLSAAQNGGMGGFSFSPMTLSLASAATTFARAYKTDATVSLNDAP